MDTYSPTPLAPANATARGATWIEPEEFAYPSGALRNSQRRARVRCPDGALRIARLGVADTFFTVPARVDVRGKRVAGFVSVDRDGGEYHFTPSKRGRNASAFEARANV